MHPRVRRWKTGHAPSMGLVVATCVAAGALSGCGATIPQVFDSSSAPAGTDDARDVVNAYVTAIVDRRPYEACAQYTATLRDRLTTSMAKQDPKLDTCHEILETTTARLRRGLPRTGRAEVLREMRDRDNVHVEVDGTKARAWLQLPRSSEASTNVELVNQGGVWRISAVGLR